MKLFIQLSIAFCVRRFRIKNLFNKRFLQRNGTNIEFAREGMPRTDFFLDVIKSKPNLYDALIYERKKNMPARYVCFDESSSRLFLGEHETHFELPLHASYVQLKYSGTNKCVEVDTRDNIHLVECNTTSIGQKFALVAVEPSQSGQNDSNNDMLNINIHNKDRNVKDMRHHSDIIDIRPNYGSQRSHSDNFDYLPYDYAGPERRVGQSSRRYDRSQPVITTTSSPITTVILQHEITTTLTRYNTSTYIVTRSATNYVTVSSLYTKTITVKYQQDDRHNSMRNSDMGVPTTTRIVLNPDDKYYKPDQIYNMNYGDNYLDFRENGNCRGMNDAQCKQLYKSLGARNRGDTNSIRSSIQPQLGQQRQHQRDSKAYDKQSQYGLFGNSAFLHMSDDILSDAELGIECDYEKQPNIFEYASANRATPTNIARTPEYVIKNAIYHDENNGKPTLGVLDKQPRIKDPSVVESLSGGLLLDPNLQMPLGCDEERRNDILCDLRNSLV